MARLRKFVTYPAHTAYHSRYAGERKSRLHLKLTNKQIVAGVPSTAQIDAYYNSIPNGNKWYGTDKVEMEMWAASTEMLLVPNQSKVPTQRYVVSMQKARDLNSWNLNKVVGKPATGKPNAPFVYRHTDGQIYKLVLSTYVCDRCGAIFWSIFRHKGSQYCTSTLSKRVGEESGLERTYYPQIYNAAKAAGQPTRMMIERAIYLVPTGSREISKVYFKSDLRKTMSLADYMQAALSNVKGNTKDAAHVSDDDVPGDMSGN